MKHVVLFNEGSRAAIYGIGSYIRELTGCLKDIEGISLYVAQLNSDEKECRVVEANGYCTFFLPSLHQHASDASRYYRNTWYILCSYFQAKETGQIIFHLNYFQEYPVIGYAKKKYPNSRVLFTIHYQDWCFALNGNISYFKEIIHKEKDSITDETEKKIFLLYEEEKKMHQAVDCTICLSRFTQQLLIDEYDVPEGKTILMYNGLKDEGCIFPQNEKSLLKQALMIPGDEKIILFAGRLDDIKGIEFLIRAFREIINAGITCRLIIAGDGNYSTYMKEAKGIWSKIIFTGRLEKEVLYNFYRIADAGVLPSFHEQCSYVAIEMMMFGIPLIVADTTGATESVADNRTGFIIPVLPEGNKQSIDINLLAEKIICLLKNDLRNDARMNYLEKYNTDLFRKNILNCYNK